jgi:hypothetical protein
MLPSGDIFNVSLTANTATNIWTANRAKSEPLSITNESATKVVRIAFGSERPTASSGQPVYPRQTVRVKSQLGIWAYCEEATQITLCENGFVQGTGGADSWGSSVSTLDGEYSSPEDFTASYSSATELALTSLPFTPTVDQFVSVRANNTTSGTAVFMPDAYPYTWDSSTGVLSVGGGAWWGASDTFRVSIDGQKRAYNTTLGAYEVEQAQPLSAAVEGAYNSPDDFTADYSTTSGIELSGLPFTPVAANFAGVEVFSNQSLTAVYTPKSHVFDYTDLTASGLLNVGGASWGASDTFRVSLVGQSKGYSTALSAHQVAEVAPISDAYASETVADVTNEDDASSDYYITMDGYQHCMVQYEVVGGTDTLALSVHGTTQDDGTAAASCLYQDITQYGMDIVTWSTASGTYDVDTTLTTTAGTAWKYLKLNVAATGGANDGDYKIFARKWY